MFIDIFAIKITIKLNNSIRQFALEKIIKSNLHQINIPFKFQVIYINNVCKQINVIFIQSLGQNALDIFTVIQNTQGIGENLKQSMAEQTNNLSIELQRTNQREMLEMAVSLKNKEDIINVSLAFGSEQELQEFLRIYKREVIESFQDEAIPKDVEDKLHKTNKHLKVQMQNRIREQNLNQHEKPHIICFNSVCFAAIFVKVYKAELATLERQYPIIIYPHHQKLKIYSQSGLSDGFIQKIYKMKRCLNLQLFYQQRLCKRIRYSSVHDKILLENDISYEIICKDRQLAIAFYSIKKSKLEIRQLVQKLSYQDLEIIHLSNKRSLLFVNKIFTKLIIDQIKNHLKLIADYYNVKIEINSRKFTLILHTRHTIFRNEIKSEIIRLLGQLVLVHFDNLKNKALMNYFHRSVQKDHEKEHRWLKYLCSKDNLFIVVNKKGLGNSNEFVHLMSAYREDNLAQQTPQEINILIQHILKEKKIHLNFILEKAKELDLTIANQFEVENIKNCSIKLKLKKKLDGVKGNSLDQRFIKLMDSYVKFHPQEKEDISMFHSCSMILEENKQVNVLKGILEDFKQGKDKEDINQGKYEEDIKQGKNEEKREVTGSQQNIKLDVRLSELPQNEHGIKVTFKSPKQKELLQQTKYEKSQRNFEVETIFNEVFNKKFKSWNLILSSALTLPSIESLDLDRIFFAAEILQANTLNKRQLNLISKKELKILLERGHLTEFFVIFLTKDENSYVAAQVVRLI